MKTEKTNGLRLVDGKYLYDDSSTGQGRQVSKFEWSKMGTREPGKDVLALWYFDK